MLRRLSPFCGGRARTHETHAETALGEASARSARYPPALNVALADVIDEVCMQ